MNLTQFAVDDGPHNSDGLMLRRRDGTRWRSSNRRYREIFGTVV
jgi:hypothetical protein